MLLRWLVAALHLLALAVGAGAISVRAWALRSVSSDQRLDVIFRADSLWGVAAALWIATGVWRAFGGLEKGTQYYLASTAFWTKMSLLLVILVLEVKPMITLIKWRIAKSRQAPIDLRSAPVLARISGLQLLLVIAMIFAAAAMARGLWS